jgi:hypothetical protein
MWQVLSKILKKSQQHREAYCFSRNNLEGEVFKGHDCFQSSSKQDCLHFLKFLQVEQKLNSLNGRLFFH